MMYLERLISTGMPNNPYWYSLEYNWFAKSNPDLWLPNCTNYCCGAVSEKTGRNLKSEVPRRNAVNWYADSNWQKSAKPALGAIAVFDGKLGHVAMVERINADGTVLLSQSNYNRGTTAERNANYFQLVTTALIPAQVAPKIGLKFLGYLINPYIVDRRVERDKSKRQVEVTMEKVRARKSAGGEAYTGLFIPVGVYDILEESGDWLRVDDEVWFSKGEWAQIYEPEQTSLSSLVEKLRDQIDALNVQNDMASKELEEERAQIAVLRGANRQLQSAYEELQAQVEELKKETAKVETDWKIRYNSLKESTDGYIQKLLSVKTRLNEIVDGLE